jgi:HK97 gp10 family phage protein
VSGMVEMKVTGLDALHDKLLELQAELAIKALAQAARKAFKPVLEAAKDGVPIWSGALRDAIKLTVKKPKDGDAVVVVGLYVSSKSAYATGELPPARRWHFIELGTANLAAHPYLRPALDGQASTVLDGLKTELAKSIARAVKKGGPK